MSFTIFWKGKLPFQAIKTRTSKSRNIDIFQEVLTHGSDPKMAIFLFCFFSQYRPGKFFYDILHREIAFLGYKKKNLKSRTIDIIPKGLTHGFGQKMAFFPTFFFGRIQARKMSFTIFQNERKPFKAIKTRSSKVKKLTFFQRGEPIVLIQKWPFFQLFFLVHIGQENVFYDILERKNAFLGYKNKTFKSSKN